MTDDEIKADRALCDAATPGPWRLDPMWRGSVFCPVEVDGEITERVMVEPNCHFDGVADAHFIASARTRWPAALDEVERLRIEVWKLEGLAAAWKGHGTRAEAEADSQLAVSSDLRHSNAALAASLAEARSSLSTTEAALAEARGEVTAMEAVIEAGLDLLADYEDPHTAGYAMGPLLQALRAYRRTYRTTRQGRAGKEGA